MRTKHRSNHKMDQSIAVENVQNSILITNLPFDAKEQSLIEIFSEVGDLLDLKLSIDPKTGKQRPFATCEYTHRSIAESAVRNLGFREYKEKRLQVTLLELAKFGKNGLPVGGIGSDSAQQQQRNQVGSDLIQVRFVTEEEKCKEDASLLDCTNYHPDAPIGIVVAKAASSLMAMSGAFTMPTDGKGAAMDLLSKRVGDLTPTQMFDVVRELKEMATVDPIGTRNLLSANPQLCLAAFQCQLALGMVKAPVDIDQHSAQVPLGGAVVVMPPPPVQQQQQQMMMQPPQTMVVPPVGRGVPPPPPPVQQQLQQQQQQQVMAPPPMQQQQQQVQPDQSQLLAQVMALTPQQIAALPPDQRIQVEQLRQIAVAQGLV